MASISLKDVRKRYGETEAVRDRPTEREEATARGRVDAADVDDLRESSPDAWLEARLSQSGNRLRTRDDVIVRKDHYVAICSVETEVHSARVAEIVRCSNVDSTVFLAFRDQLHCIVTIAAVVDDDELRVRSERLETFGRHLHVLPGEDDDTA